MPRACRRAGGCCCRRCRAAAAPRAAARSAAAGVDAAAAGRFARLALACVHKEYPNKIAHVLGSDADVKPPRELTPAFYGCYDWHSAVHGHWLLARLARTVPDAPFAAERARRARPQSLTPENIAAEVRYLAGPGRVSFERPYGLAWLLQLAAELREWNDPRGAALGRRRSRPLEDGGGRADEGLAAEAVASDPRSASTIRRRSPSGSILDWARVAGDAAMVDLLTVAHRGLLRQRPGCPTAPTSRPGRTSSRRAWPRPT